MDTLPLVLTTDHDTPERIAKLRARLSGVSQVRALPEDRGERRRALATAVVLLAFAWRIPRDELALLGRLRLVQSVWAGVDRIPVSTLAEARPDVVIAGGNGPNAAQTAEHALGLYLDCAKRLTLRDRALRCGEWLQELQSRRVEGSRVAVLGYGAIGRRIAAALDALAADVVVATRDGHADDGRTAMTLDGIRAKAGSFDGMLLALPLTRSTRGLIDSEWLAAMRPDAVLVNVARGRLIDEDALYEHLATHPRFHAGLDVWWDYPDAGDPFRQRRPFHGLDNVVMTPHSAFHVPGTRDEMLAGAADNVARFLRGEPVRNRIDLGEY